MLLAVSVIICEIYYQFLSILFFKVHFFQCISSNQIVVFLMNNICIISQKKRHISFHMACHIKIFYEEKKIVQLDSRYCYNGVCDCKKRIQYSSCKHALIIKWSFTFNFVIPLANNVYLKCRQFLSKYINIKLLGDGNIFYVFESLFYSPSCIYLIKNT